MSEENEIKKLVENVDINNIESPTIKRLIEEVRNEVKNKETPTRYNRMHNRHNRS